MMTAQGPVATEFKVLASLAVPIIVTQLSQMGMHVADAIMAGRLSPVDLSGVALGVSFFVPAMLLLSGIIMAVTPLVSQLHGGGRDEEAGSIVRQALWVAFGGGLLVTVLMQFGDTGYSWIGVDPVAIPIASSYLVALSFGLIPVLGYFTLRYLCEGMSWTTPAMMIAISALGLKVLLNYLFIYGVFGMPALGGVGCGVSGAIVMWYQLIAMVMVVRHSRIKRAGALSRFDWPDLSVVRRLLKLGLPIGAGIFLEVAVFSIVTLLIGRLGVDALASHQIAFNVGGIAFMIPLALGMAATIRVGSNVGAKAYSASRRSAFVALGASVVFAVSAAAVVFAFRESIASLYTTDPAVVEMASGLLVFVAFYQLLDDTQITAIGALRGYKDTRTPMFTSALAYWVIALPVGVTLGFGLGPVEAMGVRGFWVGLFVGLTFAALILISRVAWLSSNQRRIDAFATG
jgi:MATE family multidrug resistance protein